MRPWATAAAWCWSPPTARSIGGACPTWTAPRSSTAYWQGKTADASASRRPGRSTSSSSYRPDSNALEQVFSTASGRARVTYSLNSGPSGRLPWSELAHRVEGLENTVEFGIEVRPGRRLGQANPWREPSPHGDVLHLDGIVSALRTGGDVERLIEADDRVTARLATQADSHSVLALLASSNEPLILPPLAAIDARIDQPDQAWREWSGNLAYEGRYGDAVRRSALALKMYTLDGDLAPGERELDLPGYRNSKPVREGNRAREHIQLGVFGDLMETAALLVECRHVLDLQTRRLLADLADRWRRERIRDWVDAHCWSDTKQSYTMHPGTDRLDASLLLATRFGFECSDRLALTRDAVRRELCRDPLVLRYSGMEAEEGTFLACAFWLVEAFALLGEHDAAVQQIDALLAGHPRQPRPAA
jgi:GH15 family glucan-1,4-alpha-glucosidase